MVQVIWSKEYTDPYLMSSAIEISKEAQRRMAL